MKCPTLKGHFFLMNESLVSGAQTYHQNKEKVKRFFAIFNKQKNNNPTSM
jgi:hypothetical protein